MILFALCLTVILAFGALVIDLGVLRNNRQILVNAVDAGVLAAGTKLPVTGSAAAAALEQLVQKTLDANYPGGLGKGTDYTIAYQCVIGVAGGVAAVWRDVPTVCNPPNGVGLDPVPTTAFSGAGPSRYAPCAPGLGDTCNAILISASTQTRFALGPVVGVNSGSSGSVQSAACSGACGIPPNSPDDVVLVMDRTGSMSPAAITAIQKGAYAVLSVFDPKYQRLALGTIGPSQATEASCPNSGSPWYAGTVGGANANVLGVGVTPAGYPASYDTTTDQQPWIPVGFSGTDTAPFVSLDQPEARGHREAYSTGGAVSTSSALYKAISCLVTYTNGTNLSTPMVMATNYLSAYGRGSAAPKVIIFETDGTPAGTGRTCQAAYNAAKTAKDAGYEVFTLGYGGVSTQKCPDAASTSPSMATAADLLRNMASTDTPDVKHFYLTPDETTVVTSFAAIAHAITMGKGHLVTLYPQPYITSVSPAAGPFTGGTGITVTGKSFLGVTKVTVGGVNAAFAVNSDTSLTVVAPGGNIGSAADIIASSPGGSSPIVPADVFTYQ